MPDLAGRLIVPTFAEPHTHLDRAFSSAITGWNRSGSLDEAVERFLGSIDRMTVESLAPGGRRALGLLYDAGVGHVRTHTAVGGPLGFRALAAAGVAVVVCPVSNLCLQGRAGGARGLAPIRWLRDADVRIGIGLDNIRDVVVSVGTADPLRAAWLVAVAGHLTGEDDLEWLGRTVTGGNRRICNLPEDVEDGGTADLLVVEAASLAEAVALVPPRQRLVG